jgi:hypothetical protein
MAHSSIEKREEWEKSRWIWKKPILALAKMISHDLLRWLEFALDTHEGEDRNRVTRCMSCPMGDNCSSIYSLHVAFPTIRFPAHLNREPLDVFIMHQVVKPNC